MSVFCLCFPDWVLGLGTYKVINKCPVCQLKTKKSPCIRFVIGFECLCMARTVHLFSVIVHQTCSAKMVKAYNIGVAQDVEERSCIIVTCPDNTLNLLSSEEIGPVVFCNERIPSMCVVCGTRVWSREEMFTCRKCEVVCYCSMKCGRKHLKNKHKC